MSKPAAKPATAAKNKPATRPLLLPAPTPSQVADSRRQSGLSQAAMAESLGLSGPARIAEYESGKHAMPAAVWSFWLLVCGQHPRH